MVSDITTGLESLASLYDTPRRCVIDGHEIITLGQGVAKRVDSSFDSLNQAINYVLFLRLVDVIGFW